MQAAGGGAATSPTPRRGAELQLRRRGGRGRSSAKLFSQAGVSEEEDFKVRVHVLVDFYSNPQGFCILTCASRRPSFRAAPPSTLPAPRAADPRWTSSKDFAPITAG